MVRQAHHEGVVDIQNDPLGSLGIGFAIEVDHGAPHAQQRPGVGQVLQPRDRRLGTQFAIRARQIERHLEHRIGAQRIGVVAVLITRRDHQQAKPDNVRHRMRDVVGSAQVNDAGGHALGDAQAALDLAQSQNPAVRRQKAAIKFDDHILAGNRRETGQRQHRIAHSGRRFPESRVVLIRCQNHTRNQRCRLHLQAPAELCGLAGERFPVGMSRPMLKKPR